MPMGPRALSLAVLLCAAPGLAGAPSPARASEGQLSFAVNVSLVPSWFDPAETPGVITPFLMLYALHDALVKPMPGNAWAPCLAESWTASRDGLTHEFVLRRGVRFHNGDALGAEDVKFSFERYQRGGDRSQGLYRARRRRGLPQGPRGGGAVPLRLVHPRRRAGAGGERRLLA